MIDFVPNLGAAKRALAYMAKGRRPMSHEWHNLLYFRDSGELPRAYAAIGEWVRNGSGKDPRAFYVASYVPRVGAAHWFTDPEFWAPLTWAEARAVASKISSSSSRALIPLHMDADLFTWKPST